MDLVTRVQGLLTKSLAAEGFNIAWNVGQAAGQSVPHVHIHIVPRKKGDAGVLEYEPRKFLYRPGSREVAPEDELRAVAAGIRRHI